MRERESGDDDIEKRLGKGREGEGRAIGRGATGANIQPMEKDKRKFYETLVSSSTTIS
jgi:hypothetical protein